MKSETLPVGAYRMLLRILPEPVRRRDAEEMVATFAAMCSEASGRSERIRCLIVTFGRLPRVALAEWRDHLLDDRGARRGRAGGTGMDFAWRTLRAGLRSLGRAPTFALSASLLLAVGIGAVTTIFTIFDHLFLRPLPYPDAERLVRVSGSQSHPAVGDLESIASVEGWAAASIDAVHLTGSGDPLRIGQARVTEGFFDFFGARPEAGRLLAPEDYAAADVVVLSHDAWLRVWGGSEDVVGSSLRVNGEPVLVVGVLSSSFAPPEALLDGAVADVWRPIDSGSPDSQDRYSRSLVVAGRLAPGATLDDVRAEAAALAERRAREFPDVYVRQDGSLVELPVVTLHEATVGSARGRIGLLLGAVALLLLVACVNVAHLFMARGLARSREMAVRRALGADTSAIAAQLLVESVLVAAVGAAAGALLAVVGVETFVALDPEALPRGAAVAVDARVLAFAALLSTLTAVLFGLLPTLRVMGRGPGDALRSRGRGVTAARRSKWARDGMVSAEIALSLVLLFCAGLLTRSFLGLHAEPLGFRVADVWTIRIGLPEEDAGWRERMDRMAGALSAAPGVHSVAWGLSAPLEHVGGSCCWTRPIRRAESDAPLDALVHPFAGALTDVFEPRVLAGRPWDDELVASAVPPAVLNERIARELFGSVPLAVGREIAIGDARHVVVGVVAEDRHYGLYREHGPALYVPMSSLPFVPDRLTVAVRMDAAVVDAPRRLREAIWRFEPDLPLPLVRSMDEWSTAATARSRFDSLLFAAFGAVALLLAAAGLYGTLLYVVGLERREMGIRLALGARRRAVEARVLGRGLRPAALGACIGAAAAWAAGRLLQSRLVGVEPGDPATLSLAVTVLFVTAAVACWVPARRAGRIDPVETLREE